MWSSIKLIIAGELILFTGTSIFWVYLAKSRDFRFQLYQKYPFVLNAYYKFDDLFMHHRDRSRDYNAWNIKSE